MCPKNFNLHERLNRAYVVRIFLAKRLHAPPSEVTGTAPETWVGWDEQQPHKFKNTHIDYALAV
jgi:hypothetical protein